MGMGTPFFKGIISAPDRAITSSEVKVISPPFKVNSKTASSGSDKLPANKLAAVMEYLSQAPLSIKPWLKYPRLPLS